MYIKHRKLVRSQYTKANKHQAEERNRNNCQMKIKESNPCVAIYIVQSWIENGSEIICDSNIYSCDSKQGSFFTILRKSYKATLTYWLSLGCLELYFVSRQIYVHCRIQHIHNILLHTNILTCLKNS